jgi:hypothetical protein
MDRLPIAEAGSVSTPAAVYADSVSTLAGAYTSRSLCRQRGERSSSTVTDGPQSVISFNST